MNVLVVGNGGREHALAWKLSQSSRCDRVFVAPGNAGTAIDAENVDIPGDDIPRLIEFAKQNQVGLTVIGPEAPLALGIVDAFQEAGLRVFGPAKNAAELEASKVFCKNLLRQADVPTADYQVFRDAETAERFIVDRYRDATEVPVVIRRTDWQPARVSSFARPRKKRLKRSNALAATVNLAMPAIRSSSRSDWTGTRRASSRLPMAERS